MTAVPARIPGLTQAQHDAVEALFAQDLPGGQPAKLSRRVAEALTEKRMVASAQRALPGWPPVTVTVFRLTLIGHFEYCSWAAKQPSPDGEDAP